MSPDPTPVQYDICETMQAALEPVVFGIQGSEAQRKLIIEGFRGVAKSLIASVMTIWGLYWNPNLNFLIISASKERADAFSTFTLRCIRELPELQWLQPGENSRDSMIAFDVGPAPAAHAPSVKSVGITGMITGSRADIFIADDIEVPNNSETDVKRARLAELTKELAGAVTKPLSAALYLGTPQVEDSLYETLVKDRGYARRIWPARYPDQAWMAVYGQDLSPFLQQQLEADPSLEGKPTDPARFNELVLLEKEAEYARSGFSLQFMLDTSPNEANRRPLKLADLIVADFSIERAPIDLIWSNAKDHRLTDLPCVGYKGDGLFRPSIVSQELGQFEGCVMTIDPAGRGSDETGICVTKLLGSMIFVPHLEGRRGGYGDDNLIHICELAKSLKVRKIVPESNFGNGMWTSLLLPHLRRIYPECAVEEIHSVGQKERRIIETLEPVLNQHRLVVATQVIRDDLRPVEGVSPDEAVSYRFCHQLTRITRDRGSLKHDDRLESLAMGVAFWVNHLKTSKEVAQKKAIDRETEDVYLSWYRDTANRKKTSAVGHRSSVQRFIRPQPLRLHR